MSENKVMAVLSGMMVLKAGQKKAGPAGPQPEKQGSEK
jgi:hypothetical protein